MFVSEYKEPSDSVGDPVNVFIPKFLGFEVKVLIKENLQFLKIRKLRDAIRNVSIKSIILKYSKKMIGFFFVCLFFKGGEELRTTPSML